MVIEEATDLTRWMPMKPGKLNSFKANALDCPEDAWQVLFAELPHRKELQGILYAERRREHRSCGGHARQETPTAPNLV
jgi:hypothetical protein